VPVGYLRILSDPDEMRIGRVVTAQARRGQGVSGRLVEAALELIGDGPAVLDAQTYVMDFYARFGFRPTGPGIPGRRDPAHPMRRG